MMAPAPRFSASIFYAFRTPFQRVFDKSFSHPADRPLKALKIAGFYPSKCVGYYKLSYCIRLSINFTALQ